MEEAGARIDHMGNVFAGPVGIAMTRVLGDDRMACVGVIPTPTVLDIPVTDNDDFVVLVSDGISAVMSDDAIANTVGPLLTAAGGGFDSGDDLEAALAHLAERAAGKWQDGLPCEVKVDDITAAIVRLAP